MTAQTRHEILAIIADIAPEVATAELADDVELRGGLDLDSMDLLNVMLRVKERLGVEVPEVEAARAETLGALVACVDQRRRNEAPPSS